MIGVGAVMLPVPPLEAVYQSKFVPGAVSAMGVSFRQYSTGVTTAGAAGVVFIFTTIALLGPSQIPIVELT